MTPPTILIVDDDDSIRSLLAATLQQHEYQVLEAVNGKEAFDLFREHHPSLVISDVEMPEMDGFQLLSVIKSDLQYGLTPVILMSGAFTDLKNLRFGLSNGADDYILKPFDSGELIQSTKARLKQYAKVGQKIKSELDHWKDNMALMLPHELNTPLTGILGCAECILDEAVDRDLEEVATLSKGILASGNRLNRLIKNFLFYIQLNVIGNRENSPFFFNTDLKKAPHDIYGWSREVEEQYMRTGDLNLDVKTNETQLLPEILNRIVTELIDNALKFSQPGTSVHLLYEAVDSVTLLEVSDQGTGFDPGIQKFGAFEQFNRKLQEQQGLGLGLYIAQTLVNATRGTLLIHSTPGKGTRATVKWPDV